MSELPAPSQAALEEWARQDRVQEEVDRAFAGPGTNGATFLLDRETKVNRLWGRGLEVLWARGEPLYIAGGPGTGKSTLAQQLALRRSGVRSGGLLGFDVEAAPGRTLYLAADRPKQIARSWRRMVNEDDRLALAQTLVVHEGSPDFSISASPEHLLPWVRSFPGVDTLFIDSLLDLAPAIGKDEDGAAKANAALQSLVAKDIEVVVVHHDRKHDSSERTKVRLDDVYGGRPISKGAGSVLYLDGEPGTLRGRLWHLKVPANRVPRMDYSIIATKGEIGVV